jgi:NAD(P)-dependent dehydrogenase (short-subunit alcohol dehydrogenase family)
MDRLKNKVAIVAGAGSRGNGIGIGEAIALHLARQGANVLGIDINPDAIKITSEMVLKEGYRVEEYIGDVSSQENCVKAIAYCKERFGGVDILVNNVGIGRGFGLEETTVDEWETTFKANVESCFLMTKAAFPSIKERGGGSIINISSLAAIRVNPIIAYSASKGAINSMTIHLANRLARYNIRVNAVLPGYIDTPLVAPIYADEKLKERDIRKVPLRRLGQANDVASAVVFLASDESAYITGVLLPVDGGMTTSR